MDALMIIICLLLGVASWFRVSINPNANGLARAFGILIAIPTLLFVFQDKLLKTTSPVWNNLEAGWVTAIMIAFGLVLAFNDWVPFAKKSDEPVGQR